MYNKFCIAIKNFRRGQKGITGLETAIILIAFVTVASVLAYSVLSAGIFSSERGKAAVYAGLSSAQSTMGLKGSVVGTSNAGVNALESCTFHLALAIAGDSVDLNNLVINYWDSGLGVTNLPLNNAPKSVGYHKSGTFSNSSNKLMVFSKGETGAGTLKLGPLQVGKWSFVLSDGSGGHILSGTLEAVITVTIPTGANVGSYQTFTIQINPPTGASITIQRSLPPIAAIMTLN
jgi:archaeal flagellin FlaB